MIFTLFLFISIIVSKEVNKTRFPEYIKLFKDAIKEEKYLHCHKIDCFDGNLHLDLKHHSRGINKEAFDKAAKDQSLIHYKIIDGKVSRSNNCAFEHRCEIIDNFISNFSKNIPDCEFLMGLESYAINRQDAGVPIFSPFRYINYYKNVMFPSWNFILYGESFADHYPLGVGDWENARIELNEENKKYPWESKIDQVFFRGTRKLSIRDKAVKLTRLDSSLYNVHYVKNQAWNSNEDSGGFEPVEDIHMRELCKYKYLLDLPSYHASSRTRHLFICGSLVLKSIPDFHEFWTTSLKPWFHYIPIDKELKDIQEKVQFAIENPEIAKQIAENGRKFVYDNLDMETVYNYWEELLDSYAHLGEWEVEESAKFQKINSNIEKDEL